MIDNYIRLSLYDRLYKARLKLFDILMNESFPLAFKGLI